MSMRSWKSNPYVGLILLVIAFGAGWLTYRTVKRPGEVPEYSYVLKCSHPDCGRVFEASYPEGRKPPFPCPFCASPAYLALRCRACGEIFPSIKSPSKQAPYICPKCGERMAFPLEPGQIPLEAPSPDG